MTLCLREQKSAFVLKSHTAILRALNDASLLDVIALHALRRYAQELRSMAVRLLLMPTMNTIAKFRRN